MRISVRLDSDRVRKLEELARRTRSSTTEIVKRAIDLYHERESKPSDRPYDVLMRSGFIGSGASGDPDFSTTYRKYLFEDLGREHGDR